MTSQFDLKQNHSSSGSLSFGDLVERFAKIEDKELPEQIEDYPKYTKWLVNRKSYRAD